MSIRKERGGIIFSENPKAFLQEGDIVFFNGWIPAIVLKNINIMKNLKIYSDMYDFTEGVFIAPDNSYNKDVDFMVINKYRDDLTYNGNSGRNDYYSVDCIWRIPGTKVDMSFIRSNIHNIPYLIKNPRCVCIWKRKK